MAIVTEDRLYDGKPRGVGVYNANRSGYGGIAAGITEIPDEYVTESELTNALEGDIGDFIGNDLTNDQITITHNLGRTDVFVVLENASREEINKSNYKSSPINSNSLTLTVVYPYEETTQFYYRIL